MPHLFSFLKLMRPYLTRLLLIVLIAGAFFLPFPAQAGISDFVLPAAGCILGGAVTGGSVWVACGIGAAAAWFGGDLVLGKALDAVVWIINFIAGIVIAIILPMVVRFLNFTISMNLQPLTHFQPVLDATQVVRDFANLVLIAILIIIAMATIVGMESYGVRRALPLLIGLALIVNFSTVIVGTVIDSGNTVMRFFWESSGFNETSMDQYIIRNMKLSQAAAQGSQSEIEELLKEGGLANTSAAVMKAMLYVIIILLTLLAIYIFLRLALVFLVRVAAVWILVITAPIIFIMGAVPFGKSRQSEWWKELFNWTFLGPVVFFFLFFGIIIWTQLNQFFAGHAVVTEANGTNIAYAAGSDGSKDLQAFSLFFILPIVLFFFQYALNASKKMAGSVANSLVDSAISVGKGVALGGLALGAGAAVAGIGGNLLRRPGAKKMYERLQQSGLRPLQKIGSRLEGAHKQAVQKETEKSRATYAGLDELSTGTLDPATGTYTAGSLIDRWDKLDARQKVAAAGILMERKQALPDNIAREALALAPSIDKDIEKKLKRQAPNMRFASADSQHAGTGGIDVASFYNYASTNNISPLEYSPEALKNSAIVGTMGLAELRSMAQNGTQEQLASAIEGFNALHGNADLQRNIAGALAARGGLDPAATAEFITKYTARITAMKDTIDKQPIFRLGRLGGTFQSTARGGTAPTP